MKSFLTSTSKLPVMGAVAESVTLTSTSAPTGTVRCSPPIRPDKNRAQWNTTSGAGVGVGTGVEVALGVGVGVGVLVGVAVGVLVGVAVGAVGVASGVGEGVGVGTGVRVGVAVGVGVDVGLGRGVAVARPAIWVSTIVVTVASRSGVAVASLQAVSRANPPKPIATLIRHVTTSSSSWAPLRVTACLKSTMTPRNRDCNGPPLTYHGRTGRSYREQRS